MVSMSSDQTWMMIGSSELPLSVESAAGVVSEAAGVCVSVLGVLPAHAVRPNSRSTARARAGYRFAFWFLLCCFPAQSLHRLHRTLIFFWRKKPAEQRHLHRAERTAVFRSWCDDLRLFRRPPVFLLSRSSIADGHVQKPCPN